jgi:hypothetical protein
MFRHVDEKIHVAALSTRYIQALKWRLGRAHVDVCHASAAATSSVNASIFIVSI